LSRPEITLMKVPDSSISIAIADDHPIFLMVLSNMFEMDGHKVPIKAKNALELLQGIEKTGLPDIILLDIRMPGMDGLEGLLTLKTKYPACKVIILSFFEHEEIIRQAVNYGANGYLVKTVNREELYKAVLEVHAGRDYLTKFVSEVLSRNSFN
jgi:DNA-binding NarL/FixJ family response regulator